MSIGLLGNKIGMTQIFDKSDNIIPVTILKVGPCVVTQIKTKIKDGYDAIQVGYSNSSHKSLTQPELGHLQKSNIRPLKYLKEFHVSSDTEFEIGKILTVDDLFPSVQLTKFKEKQEKEDEEREERKKKEDKKKKKEIEDIDLFVNVKGKTIGKGFSGLQKRHNFTRGPMTHGSKNHRAPGSIGMGTTPGRVLPGKKMSGQLGDKVRTIKKLKVIQINSKENILVIKGSVPGKPGNLLSIIPSE